MTGGPLADLPDSDRESEQRVLQRSARVLRPPGALQRLDQIAGWLASWQGTDEPAVRRPAAAVFVADHGVAAAGVSAFPAEVTASMLGALRDGVATAAALSRSAGVSLTVVDVGTGRPTEDLRMAAALDPGRFEAAWAAGSSCVGTLDADLLVVGEMGIGNTTAAAAVAAGLAGGPVDGWVGSGTGVDAAGRRRKVAAVEQALARLAGDEAPLEVLRQVGGAELVAIAGAIVAARRRRLPVLLDGFVVTAAAAALEATQPGALDHCWAAHRSPEPGHDRLLQRLGKEPLLDLGMRLGEGSGALLAVPLVAMAAVAVTEVATFEERGLVP